MGGGSSTPPVAPDDGAGIAASMAAAEPSTPVAAPATTQSPMNMQMMNMASQMGQRAIQQYGQAYSGLNTNPNNFVGATPGARNALQFQFPTMTPGGVIYG